MMPIGIKLLIFALAVFRITYLLTKEAGPFHLAKKLRLGMTKKAHLDEGIKCPYCTGMWVCIVFTYLFFHGPEWTFYFVFMLGLGGAAMVIHQLFVYLFEHS